MHDISHRVSIVPRIKRVAGLVSAAEALFFREKAPTTFALLETLQAQSRPIWTHHMYQTPTLGARTS